MSTSTRTRLSPAERRSQLLDLGVKLLATRSLDELSIDVLAEEAGISRGLLYHYFGNKHDFHEAVVRRAADDLIAQTAPPPVADPLERLAASMQAYLTYVENNFEGYLSLIKGAASGNETLRAIYEESRTALTDRIFADDVGQLIHDTPVARLVVRGWAAFSEEIVVAWIADPAAVTRESVLHVLSAALPALVAATESVA